MLRLEELGCLTLHFFHARLMGSIEGALVFQSLGLHFGLPCLHPTVALLGHLGLLLEALFFQLLLYRLGRSSHAVEDGWSCSRAGPLRSRHSCHGCIKT